ncbi:gamma-interferon-inducible lysosomal thiol reductase-like, partial [Anoplophora glabripennis]
MWKKVMVLAILCGYGGLAQKIKISVYYETLCPYSVRFLVDQFNPAYQNLTDNMEVDLIPYGKAT